MGFTLWNSLFPAVDQCLIDESRIGRALPSRVVFSMGKLYWPQPVNTLSKTLELCEVNIGYDDGYYRRVFLWRSDL